MYNDYDPNGLNRVVESGLTDAAGGGKTWKTQTKYDTYPSNAIAFRGENQFPSSYNSSYLKGKVTTTITKIEGSAGRTEVISTPYYDDYGRVFETASQSHVAAGFIYDIKKMDFVGRVLRSRQIVVNGMTTTVEQSFSYERSSKIKSVCQKVNTELWQPVGRYAYNGIGEMTQKTLGCKLQVLSYKYDLRSRMIALNNPANLEASKSFFGMSLAYDEVGNINKQTYSFAQRKGKHTDPFAVKQNDIFYDNYEYDAQNRLSWSKLSKGTVDNIIYKLDNMSYDANGNIKTLERWWQGQYKDRLVYDYYANTNRLLKVDDSGENNNQATEEFFTENSTDATDFTYDDAGNMITDANKDISLTYNYLNLVKTAKGNSYTYTATGQKNRMVSPAGTFDYIGSVVFKNNEVEFIATPEGRVLPPAPNPNSVKQNGAKFDPPYPTAPDTTNKYWRYEYDIKDHLGNLRVACRCAEQIETVQIKPEIGYAPTVVQQAHYDPWGVKLPLFLSNGFDRYQGSPEDRFKYNGKEQQPDISYYDYGARMYDPTVGRWFGIDPLAEKFYAWSPYNYAFNNPVRFIDPTGMGPEDPITHTIKRGETLTSISKQYGVSVQDLASLNGLQNSDKIRAGTTLKVNPEMDFSNNPHGGYQNPNNSTGEVVSMNNIANVGVGFVAGAGNENVVVAGGKALESVQNWDKVKDLVSAGTTALTADGKLSKGETFTGSYSPGSLMSYLGRALKGEEKLVSPVHVVGSFGFSMRVNADGNSATIAVYDSKTNSSFSDHKLGTSSDRAKDPSKSGNQPLTTQYFRFIWNQSLK